MKKTISVLLVLLSLVLVMSACGLSSVSEISNALNKTNAANSMQFTVGVKSDFTLSGMDETLSATGMKADQLQTLLNQMAITYGGSIIKDKDSGNVSSEMNFSIDAMGQTIASKIWQKYNGDGTIQQIVQNPQIPGLDASGKEYTVNSLSVQGAASQNSMITKILNDFVMENAKDEKFITKVEDKHYKVHIDKDKCVTLLNSIFDALKSSASGELSSSGITDEQYNQVKQILPMLLGDKGIDVELVIGDDGFVSQEIVGMDMNLNLVELVKAVGQDAAGISGEIGMKLTMDMKYTDYNKVDKIDFPEVNDTNAVFNNK